MAGFAIKGFNHTGMIVTDLDRAIGFFRDLLGFEVLSRAPRDPALLGRMTGLPAPQIEIAHLQGPGHRVELIRYATDGGRGIEPPRVYDDGARTSRSTSTTSRRRWRRRRARPRAGRRDHRDRRRAEPGRKVVYLQSAYGLLIEFIQAGPEGARRSEGGAVTRIARLAPAAGHVAAGDIGL